MAKVSSTVKGWYSKANDDLIGARSLWSTSNPRVWLLVGFHCQQAAEKAMKGFLLFNGKRIQKGPRGHSIEELSQDVVGLAPELTDLLRQAAELTPYAVQFRYPDAASATIVADDIKRALALAEKVVDEMCSRIPFEGAWDI